MTGVLLGCYGALTLPSVAGAQDLQLHYDWRHTFDARNNPHNFPALVFKTYKGMSFGSFLLKLEGDLNGSRHNLSKLYVEASQTLRFWRPPIYLQLEYTGGLGLFDGGAGGYTIDNAYILGAAHPFPWQGSWGNLYVGYKLINFPRPSHDPQFSLYWGKSFRGRWDFAATGVFWTENRNHGDAFTAGQTGKRFVLLVENEIWYRALPPVAFGSEIRVSRNVYATGGSLLVYPTIGIRYVF